jgi:hypothetical protein
VAVSPDKVSEVLEKAQAGVVPGEVPVLEEHVPIDVGQLSVAKTAMENADKVAEESASMGISLAKMVAMTASKGAEAQEAERDVQTALRQIIVTLGIVPDEFRGFDLDKGVVKIQRAPTTVEATVAEVPNDPSIAG